MNHKHCHDDTCCSTHHHHEDSCCSAHECHGHHEHEDFQRDLIQMADEAWMEVLKEKIKEKIREHSGEQLNALAALVADFNGNRRKKKLEQKHHCQAFKEKLNAFFNR